MHAKIKGLVIKEKLKGESGKILTLLTDTLGVINVNAKGVQKISAAYLKSAQLFAFSEMLLYEKNGYYTLTEANLITDFYSIRENVTSYAEACYICEAGASFAVPGEDNNDILRLVLNCLYALEKNLASHKKIKSAFELKLCAETGFLLETDECAYCGRKLENSVFFNENEGAFACSQCADLSGENLKNIKSDVIKAVSHIMNSEQKSMLSFSLPEKDMNELSEFSEKYLLTCAERNFQTLKFLKTLM